MNLILQHWTGELDELGIQSSANISAYAQRIGAEYRLLRGNVFRPNLAPPCQKMHMLDTAFDDYGIVVMLDMDMFATHGLTEDVFALEGTGLFSAYTAQVFERCRRQHPTLTSKAHAYWGGAIWRLTRERRQELRAQIVEAELAPFSGNYNDEGIMHRLAMRAGIRQDRLPDRWCQCSYLSNPKGAAMIHVRTKVTPDGPKATKLANYQSLKRQGVIE